VLQVMLPLPDERALDLVCAAFHTCMRTDRNRLLMFGMQVGWDYAFVLILDPLSRTCRFRTVRGPRSLVLPNLLEAFSRVRLQFPAVCGRGTCC
jgi:hypothetical protein